MNGSRETGCRVCVRGESSSSSLLRTKDIAPSKGSSRKRLRCSEDEAADILVSMGAIILKESQLRKTKHIKAEVELISAELDAWAARNIDFACASDEEVRVYQEQGAALLQRLDTCDRDLQFVQKMARWGSGVQAGVGE